MQGGQLRVGTAGPGGGKSKPSIHKKNDRHTTLASLLLKADLAPDPLERILAMARVVLAFTIDLMRPGQGLGETPIVILGHHVMTHRELAERHCGDAVVLMLQEICSHAPEARPTLLQGKDRGPEVLRLTLHAAPVGAVKAQRGTLAGLGGAGSPPYIEVALQGKGQVVLPRHGENYSFTLPALRFTEPQSETCPVELAGNCGVTCAESGLAMALKFRDNHVVKGVVTRAGSDARIATLTGRWNGGINVDVPELGASGTVYNARQTNPVPVPWVNLGQPGPRRLAKLWSAILESLYFLDPHQAAAYGKKAEQMAAEVPMAMKHSLLYEVAEGIKPKKAGDDASEAELIRAAAPELPLPPVVRTARAEGHLPIFQLFYSLQTVQE